VLDLENAFRFGSLLDAMLTEPHKVDFLAGSLDGFVYPVDQWELAVQMKRKFLEDPFCNKLHQYSEGQKVSTAYGMPVHHLGMDFKMDYRCKWDFYAKPTLDICADLKTTACTTEKQFIESIWNYQYNRQAALYMDIEGVDRFMLIGQSKVNLKIFKVAIRRGDEMFTAGKELYSELSWLYYTLFNDFKISA
jgi:hypothetical protein